MNWLIVAGWLWKLRWVLAAIPVLFTLWQWKQTYDENVIKDRIIAEQKKVIIVQQEQAKLDKDTISILENARKEQKMQLEALQSQLEEIDNAPETDDGDISPVLRRTIERLQRGTETRSETGSETED